MLPCLSSIPIQSPTISCHERKAITDTLVFLSYHLIVEFHLVVCIFFAIASISINNDGCSCISLNKFSKLL